MGWNDNSYLANCFNNMDGVEMNEGKKRFIYFIIVLILLTGILVTGIVVMTKHEQSKLNDSCKDLGHEEFVNLGSEKFCIDDEGYYHKVFKRNFDVFELKFREEVLG